MLQLLFGNSEQPVSMELQFVQMISQIGAVGILAFIVWLVPSMAKATREERMAERKADREAHQLALQAYREEMRRTNEAFLVRNGAVVDSIEKQTKILIERLDSVHDAIVKGSSEAEKRG